MLKILSLLGVPCAHSSQRQELLTLNELEEKDETLLKKATKSLDDSRAVQQCVSRTSTDDVGIVGLWERETVYET